MKIKTLWSTCALLLIGVSQCVLAQKIPLSQSMVTKETGDGNAGMLADEQTLAGDPLGNAGGIPVNKWDPGWSAATYTAYIDLGATFNISTVSLFEGDGGAQTIKVETGAPGSWTTLYNENLNVWHKWFNHTVSVSSRYLRFTVPHGSSLGEVVVYGSSVNVPVTAVSVTPATVSVGLGATTQLTATVSPANASNPSVTWSSSNASVASVNASGVVSGIAQGSASITATTVDQGKTSSASITVTGSTGSGKVSLSAAMITNEGNNGDATLLVDEQTVAGDPLHGSGGTPVQQWQPGYAASSFNAYIDLGNEYDITNISLFEGNGSTQNVTVSVGAPGSWTALYTESLNVWHKWFNHPTTTTTRYLRFTVPQNSSLAEVVIYGVVHNDVVPPGAITNLAAGAVTSNSIALSWTASGDDGSSGRAQSYDLRRSTAVITSANFASATQVAGLPAPGVSGTAQSFTVTGLAANTTYYFAIKSIDEKPNASAISNVVSKATQPPDTTPPATIANLTGSATGGSSIALSWSAPGDDGNVGTAVSYDLRRSTAVITSANFASATPIAGAPIPAVAGTQQGLSVGGLTPLTTYYFAIKATDEANNTSAISNVATVATTAGPARNAITFDKFMGTHGFVDDPITLMQCVGFIREYHNWNWDEADLWMDGGVQKGDVNYSRYPNNKMQFAPKFGGNWNFDTFYTQVKNAGLTISPCLQGAAAWLQNQLNYPFNDKPVDASGASTTTPNSYQAHAHHMYQFAARYGATVVPDNKLTLAADQPRNSGMNLVRYVEDWNEQNKNWKGPNAQFSPQEYAAMLSADYDGHANTMTSGTGTFGAKNADPTIKVVMGGLAEITSAGSQEFVDYLAAMKAWFQANRSDHKFAADVINIHHYAFSSSGTSGHNPGLSPEADNFEARMKLVVDYRDQNLDPETEVWLSEFGWDTNQQSPLHAPPIGPFDAQEVQAQWILRGYLACAAAGIDRAIQYMMRDDDPTSAIWFSSSGLVGPYGDWTPKKSYYYVATMKNALAGTRFLGKVSTGNAGVYAYKFKSTANSSGVYVVWCPTSTGVPVNNYVLSVPGATSATKVVLTNNSLTGTSTSLTPSNGTLTLNVSEQPVFIKVNSIQ